MTIGEYPSVAPADTQARYYLVPVKSQLYIKANMGHSTRLAYSFENDALALVKGSYED